jgi:hypothetical protein
LERFRVSVGSAPSELRENQRDDSARLHPSDAGPRRWFTEPRLLGENGALESAKGLPGLDYELLNEHLAGTPVGLEGVRLAAGAIKREHELAVEALAEGRLRYEPLELSDELGRPPQGNLGVDPPLLGQQPEFLEARDLPLCEGLEGEVGEGRASPKRQRTRESRGSSLGLARRQRFFTLSNQGFKQVNVDGLQPNAEQVAGTSSNQHGRPKKTSQLRDVNLDHVTSAGGRRFAPDLVDDLVDCDDLAAVEAKEREQGALADATEGQRLPFAAYLERTEQANFQRPFC